MLTRFVPVFVAVTLGVSLGCSREDTTPNPNTYALGVCNRFVRCAPALVRTYFGDVESCVRSYALEAKTLFALPGAKTTRSQVNACVIAIEAASCAEDLELIAACDLRGDRANGATCSSDVQCVSGSCFRGDSGECGVCGDRAAMGASCRGSSCARGLVCDPRTESCVAKAAEGESCRDLPCRSGLGCTVINPTCVVARGPGEACDAARPCDGAGGLVCEGTCVARLAKEGESCAVTPFCERGYCSELTCRAHLVEGASCSTSLECGFPLECVGGACARRPTCP